MFMVDLELIKNTKIEISHVVENRIYKFRKTVFEKRKTYRNGVAKGRG